MLNSFSKEAQMVVLFTMTALCVGSLIFCIRFFFALCKEHGYETICYVVCVKSEAVEQSILEIPVERKSLVRAA